MLWRQEEHLAKGNKQSCQINRFRFDNWCLSAVKRVWFFTDCVLVTLNVNDDEDLANLDINSTLKSLIHFNLDFMLIPMLISDYLDYSGMIVLSASKTYNKIVFKKYFSNIVNL